MNLVISLLIGVMNKMIKEIIKKYAYKIVYRDLIKNEGLYVGKYDAKHGGRMFMSGIHFVMESIAYSVSEDTGEAFIDLFFGNLIASEEEKG